jgi:hypothetical protein
VAARHRIAELETLARQGAPANRLAAALSEAEAAARRLPPDDPLRARLALVREGLPDGRQPGRLDPSPPGPTPTKDGAGELDADQPEPEPTSRAGVGKAGEGGTPEPAEKQADTSEVEEEKETETPPSSGGGTGVSEEEAAGTAPAGLLPEAVTEGRLPDAPEQADPATVSQPVVDDKEGD